MAGDELAEINGITPNVLLADGEEREVGSTTSKSKYKVKRTSDHYHCTCPAWRNQAGMPVDARTCKHLQLFLGEGYENARILLKNPDGPAPKGSKAPPKPKAKTNAKSTRAKSAAKRKRTDKNDDDEDDEGGVENDDEEDKPVPKTKTSRASKRTKVEQEDAEMIVVEEKEKETAEHAGDDNLAEINGITPLVRLKDGEETEVGSATGKSKYKVKRTQDHYYCSCPAWRNQSGVSVDARTCKHLKTLLGDAYEEARIQSKAGEATTSDKDKGKAAAAATKPKSTAKATAAETEKEDDVEMNDTGGDTGDDELAEIGGVRPRMFLRDGEETEVGSKTSKTKYKIKRTWDHYYCSCPAWRNQARVPVDARTCKHLKSLLGDTYEDARLKRKSSPSGAPASGTSKAKPPSKAKTVTQPESAAKATKSPEEDEDADMKVEEEDQDTGADARAQDVDKAEEFDTASDGGDELAEIDGIKPAVYMKDGEEREVGSLTSNSKYKVKRTWDHYYCSCPAWRNQGGAPVNARTCKHLKLLLSEAYELARIHKKNPEGPAPKSKANAKSSGKAVPELLLANKWEMDSGPDPTGWWISEKLDGVRTYYDGKQMISRLGNPFTPPQWFLDKLPKDVTLDGELFGGRGEFQSTVSIVKTPNSPQWKNITFQVFDAPSRGKEPFESRVAFLHEMFGPGGSHRDEQVVVVAQEVARDKKHVLERLKEVESLGGEGLMLRKPESVYEGFRSSTLLKIKSFYDAEAVVTGYAEGKGKNKGVTGALQCKMESGKTFSVGSGLSDKQRKTPPAIGSIIIYRFQELTRDRVPRFPTFVGIAADKDKPKDAEIPEHKLRSGAGGDDI